MGARFPPPEKAAQETTRFYHPVTGRATGWGEVSSARGVRTAAAAVTRGPRFFLSPSAFAAREMAAPRMAVEHRAARGQRLARLVRNIQRSPSRQDRYFATSQLGITLASLGLGMYGEHAIAEALVGPLESLGTSRWIAAHAVASTVAVVMLTYLHIVFGEVLPKSLTLQYAERSALWMAPPMVACRTLFYPMVVALHALANLVLRAAGIRRQLSAERYYTPEELQLIVEESEKGGLLKASASRMLADLFEFGDLTAGQVMVPRVRISGLPVGARTEEIRGLLRVRAHTRYPVYDGDLDHIIGMVHVKDLIRRLVTNEPVRAEDARSLPVVPETAALDAVLAIMRRDHAQMAVVIDEHGGTAGIVTLEDLFEEVIGEIDEGPATAPAVSRDDQGRLRVPGTLRLDELEAHLSRPVAHEAVESVSGLILTLLGRPPAVGDVVEHEGLRFEVTAVHGRGVRECAVSALK